MHSEEPESCPQSSMKWGPAVGGIHRNRQSGMRYFPGGGKTRRVAPRVLDCPSSRRSPSLPPGVDARPSGAWCPCWCSAPRPTTHRRRVSPTSVFNESDQSWLAPCVMREATQLSFSTPCVLRRRVCRVSLQCRPGSSVPWRAPSSSLPPTRRTSRDPCAMAMRPQRSRTRPSPFSPGTA